MTLDRGFKAWAERTAASIRTELDLSKTEPLEPARLAEQEAQAREPGEAGDRGQPGERGPGEAERGQPIERHRGGQRGQGARDAQEDRALPEVAPPQAARHQVAHPGHPRAVADHAEDRADRDDADEQPELGCRRDATRQRELQAEIARQSDAGGEPSAQLLLDAERSRTEMETVRREVARMKVQFSTGKRY